MGKAYLLTGEPRVGKTTTLKRIISGIGTERCGGMYTEEIRSHGIRTGFRIVTLEGHVREIASVDSNSRIRVGRYGVDLDSLNSICSKAIHEAMMNKELVIIDEIGPMQLHSDEFKQAVMHVLESPLPILGTIVLRPYPWADKLKRHKLVKLYCLTSDNSKSVADRLILCLTRQLSDDRNNKVI